MRPRVALTAIAILLTLVLAPLGAGGQAPPAPTIRHQFRIDGLPAAGPMELVKWVLDFPPGSATPPHTHPGLVLGTQLEGELTFTNDAGDKVYRAGDTQIEQPGVVGLARNTGPGRLLAMVSMVAPKGAPLSTPQPGAPPPPLTPTTLYQYRTDAIIPPGPYEVAHAVLDFAPGAQTLPHTHPGQTVVTVLEGALTFRTGGTERVFGAGESFSEPGGEVGQAANVGAVRTTALVTYLLPKGAPLSTPVQETPGLPATGGGGLPRPPAALWLLVLVAGGLITGAWAGGRLLRRA